MLTALSMAQSYVVARREPGPQKAKETEEEEAKGRRGGVRKTSRTSERNRESISGRGPG